MSASKKSDSSIREVSLYRVHGTGEAVRQSDVVAVEEPLEIRVKGEAVAVTMRTPGHDAELAAGFLFTEGLIRARADIIEIAHCQRGDVPQRDNILNVFLSARAAADFQPPAARGPVNVSCGLCGKTSIEAIHQHFPPLENTVSISADLLLQLPARLAAAQPTFTRTGGLHAAGLFTIDGELLAAREDIGRHNAVDKVLGHALMTGLLPLAASILLVSGRASFEILQKALAARIPVIAAVSAPSSLAVEFARDSNQTLIGFLRGETMNFYTGFSR
jgi:FdhD protein